MTRPVEPRPPLTEPPPEPLRATYTVIFDVADVDRGVIVERLWLRFLTVLHVLPGVRLLAFSPASSQEATS